MSPPAPDGAAPSRGPDGARGDRAGRGGVWAVVVAAGRGERFGGPKHLEDLGGRPLVTWSVAAARAACDGVVLVVASDELARPEWAVLGADVVVAGGETRSASVRLGLEAVPPAADVVVVHDAARPLATEALFRRVVDELRAAAELGGVGGVVPALAVTDTVKQVASDDRGARVRATVARHDLVAVQTPQAFVAHVLRQAHGADGEGTDDAALVEALGATVRVVPGEPDNLKVTVRRDLVVARALLAAAADAG